MGKKSNIKKLLLIAMIIMSGISQAQKKSVLLQGGMALTSSNEERANLHTKTFTYTAMPRWGYQFSDHWTAGVQWSVGRENIKTDSISAGVSTARTETKNSRFSVGAFVRFTYPLNEWFSVYADLDAGYQGAKMRITNDNFLFPLTTSTTIKGSGFAASLTPSLCINIGAKGYKLNFSVGSLGYSQLDYEDNYGSDQNFGLNFGKSFTIGLSRNFQL